MALVVVGLWLGLLVASWVAATVSFKTVDRVLGPAGSPEAQARFEPVKAEDRRMLLRHLASEINRWMFRWSAWTQVALGVIVLGLLLPTTGAPRALSAAALAIVLVQALGFTASITDLGRSIDFLPRPLPPAVGRRFGQLHAVFVILDLAKAVTLAGLAALLARRG
jgi:hypothetical protein